MKYFTLVLTFLISSWTWAEGNSSYHFLVWNIQKAQSSAWPQTMGKLSKGMDFILIQEAVDHKEVLEVFKEDGPPFRFFESWRARTFSTGLLTSGSREPDYSDHLVSPVVEPFLMTPKLISVEKFKLGLQKNLLVLNIHAINFRGIQAFKKHIMQASELLKFHEGPVVFAGDFNTWNSSRKRFLEQFCRQRGLREVKISRITSKRALDHFYMRGFKILEAKEIDVRASDHYPIYVEATLN